MQLPTCPMYFQRKYVSDITANYTLNTDQAIRVLNSCRVANGEMIRSEGVAYAQNKGKSQFLLHGLR